MARRVFAFVLALIGGVITVAVVESISSAMHPFPAEFDQTDMDQVRQFVASLPALAFVLVLLAHLLGALAAGFIFRFVARDNWRPAIWILGGFFTFFGVMNLIVIPHPHWFSILDTLIYVPSVLCGFSLASRVASDRSEATGAGSAGGADSAAVIESPNGGEGGGDDSIRESP